MKIHIFFLVFISSFFKSKSQTTDQIHPDFYLNITETVNKYGYPIESHEITTEDGYIITIFRIPHGKQGSGANKKPILLMHGLFCQAEFFIIAGMYNASLAFFLADNGFDVWIGNTRGNKHGRRHTNFSPKSKEFWTFSWHEIGMFDLPAHIDYILRYKSMEKLYYVGHSQGGTSFYILTSLRPEYQKKISVALLLAPAGYFNNFKNPYLVPIMRIRKTLEQIAEVMYEFPPNAVPLSDLLSGFCEVTPIRNLCQRVYNIFVGSDSGEVPKILVPMIAKYISSVSLRQPIHYGQAIESGHFRPWDYGKKKNQEVYGASEPPDYPIKSIQVPIAIFHGLGDTLVYPKDIDQICEDLPNCVRTFRMSNPKFTHFDIVLSRNLHKLVSEPMLNIIEEYEDES